MRKLATIVSIDDVQPIPEADKIERVRVRGWWCVSKKGEFKIGDKAVFFEPDSFLPIIPQFEFLAKGSSVKKMLVDGKEKEGYRLKTIFLRKQISQGLALPIALFPDVNGLIGDDVTELLNVRLYEPPMDASLNGEAEGSFPGFIPKTDEERIQNLLPWLDEYRGRHFSMTVKVDGTSTTIYKWQEKFGVCGRNWTWKETESNSYWKAARKYNLPELLPEGYAIQAELVGENIQDNRMRIKGHRLLVFYVWDIQKGEYLSLKDMIEFCQKIGLETVPVFQGVFELNHTLEGLLTLADGVCPLNSDVLREGLVFRLNEPGTKVSFKVISNAYLVTYGL
jgi:RNA ligase (TIGR02306 family)